MQVLVIAAAVAGCATPYFGHTKEAWEKLTKEEKEEIKKEYKLVVDSKNNQRHDDKINSRKQSILDQGKTHPKH